MAKKEKKKSEFQTEYTVMNALKKGDLFTKLSAVVFGLGNIVRGQVIKGILFLAMEIGLIYYFVSFGFHALSQLTTLGTKVTGQEWNEAKGIFEQVSGDNSMLILLYVDLAAPEFLEGLYHNPLGVGIMTSCLAVYLLAFIWGRRIVRIEV